MRRARQTSESVELAALLTLSGGLMDAYSYLARGGVFANAQTGNILLLGVSLSRGEWALALRYLAPVLSFVAGIALAHLIKARSRERHLHWRQTALLAEAALLVAVSCFGEEGNLAANSLTSLACGIQVQAFRKLHGRPFATTMCIGNMRSGIHELMVYLDERVPEQLEGALLHLGTIACFVAGAVLGSWLISLAGLGAILASPALLLVAWGVMFVDREKSAASS